MKTTTIMQHDQSSNITLLMDTLELLRKLPYELIRIHSRIRAKLRKQNTWVHEKQADSRQLPEVRNDQRKLDAADILATIYRHHVDTRGLDIAIRDQEIILNGFTESEHQKNYIGSIVACLPEVNTVRNLLQVI